jgi:C4-dicarboxylate-specific signal transduction histidine kinase
MSGRKSAFRIDLKVRRLLVVSADEATRAAVRAALEGPLREVVIPSSDEELRERMARGEVDLALIDADDPEPLGVALCSAIRDEMDQTALPILMLGARLDDDKRSEAREAGADDLVSKPVDGLDLHSRVEVLLQLKVYQEELERQRKASDRELEKTRARLLQADRFATLGTIAAGVGHELKNVAAVLTHTATFIRMAADEGKPPAPEDLLALDRGVAHLTEHAQNLLHLGAPGPDRVENLDVMAVVSDVLAMLHVAGRTKRVNVMTAMPPAPVKVAFSRTKLEQILVNLVTNAADAVMDQPPEGRIIEIEVREDRATGRARIVIEDAGSGIPPEALARVFESYYTTKAPGKGTGLGLSVVKSIVEEAGGVITIESEVGKGTAVRFDLPLAPPGAVTAPPPVPSSRL